jgi:hypothetical protein
MTYDELVGIALQLPDTEEKPSYGKPRVKRAGRDMFGIGADEGTISIGVGWSLHDRYLAEYPAVIYKTPHYVGWASFLVRLDRLDSALAKELVDAAWEAAAPKVKKKKVRQESY